MNKYTNITVVGLGKVGAVCSIEPSCLRKLGDVLLLDIVDVLPQGEALDINHQLSEIGLDCRVKGSNEDQQFERLQRLLYWLLGWEESQRMTRMDLLTTNANIIEEVATKTHSLASRAIVVVVTNPVNLITYCTSSFLEQTRIGLWEWVVCLIFADSKVLFTRRTGFSRVLISATVIGEQMAKTCALLSF